MTIGIVAAGTAGAFLFASGLLSPGRLGPATIADALQANTGPVIPGFRRAHAKGLCVIGRFESNGQAALLSKALVFRPGSIPVYGRLSTGGGNPFAPDGRVVFHAMALRFELPDGSEWRTAMDDTPTFPVATPADFLALQIATTPNPATHKPDPAKLGPFLATHPETRSFLDWMKQAPLPSSFANSPYNSINAFHFIDAAAAVHVVRWSLLPDAPPGSVDKADLKKLDPDFLFKEFLTRIGHAPQTWHLMIVLAGPDDVTDKATIAWPATDRMIDAGTLTLDRAEPEDQVPNGPQSCRDVNFDPLILPAGIAASNDPLLPARSAAYAVSYERRAVEGPRQSEMGKIALQAQGAAP